MSGPRATGRVLRFSGFRRTVRDLRRSVEFYVEALGFEVDAGTAPEPGARLRLGDESIDLVEPASGRWPAKSAADLAVSSSAFQHIAIVTGDMDAAMQRLARHAPTPISTGDAAVQLPSSSGGVTAFKFRDPDGHALELIGFPPGTGDPTWRRAGGPTLGIDHSAIGVASVERSLAFYVGLLGFREAARQVNRGDAQARLDGVDAAEVDVVALAPAAGDGPHVELLHYRTPPSRPRQATPPLAEDLADRMTFQVDDLPATLARLDTATVEWAHVGADAALLRHEGAHPILLMQSKALC